MISKHKVTKREGGRIEMFYGGTELDAARIYMRAHETHECAVNGSIYVATVSGSARKMLK